MARFRWRDPDAPRAHRVTTLELFFDLVFVFTLTRLTAYLEHHLTLAGAGRVLLLFAVLWWMYGGYAWLTNHVSPARPSQRLMLLSAMAGFMVMAVAVPHAFDDAGGDGTGVLFGVGYLVVVVIHLALFSQSSALSGVARLAPFNVTAGGLVLVAGIVDGPVRYVLWAVAVALLAVTPFLGVAPRFDIRAEHFVERHGLLLIVALGESVVAIGASVDTEHLTAGTVAVVVLALALPAALWWAFFTGDEQAAERTLRAAGPAERALRAIRGYFFAFIAMLLGIVAAAAGMHEAIAHPADPLSDGAAVALAVGIALFLVGDVAFRRALRAGPPGSRAITAALALGTIPLGSAVNAQAQLLALVVVVAAMLAVEHMRLPAGGGAPDEV